MDYTDSYGLVWLKHCHGGLEVTGSLTYYDVCYNTERTCICELRKDWQAYDQEYHIKTDLGRISPNDDKLVNLQLLKRDKNTFTFNHAYFCDQPAVFKVATDTDVECYYLQPIRY
jgi:hypothetical protein